MTETVQTIENLALNITKEVRVRHRSPTHLTPYSSRWARTIRRPRASLCP
jgi:hypothetical protein